ncbi:MULTISPECIES: rRNA maturation RNase YbeY [Kocuria]|jgi:probable rRNA maturation factor|uniref:rRNA maturation RNase YbeY n=1 Tax=Kocuria TaxID=57493 RepID=UPI002041716C|nr:MULTISPECIES: rRNA maturation RNase YbeY [Kocuria]MCM3687420.1 rRNA maturation RNase YbeY [Kocuria rosea]
MAVEFDLQHDPADVAPADREAWAAVDVELLGRLAGFALARLHVHPDAELSIAVVDEEEMARLHVEWMDLPGPTDVLSFPMDELRPGTPEQPAEGTLGDIVLCPPVARRQAEAAGHPTADELCLLTVHGILHLLGHDHAEPGERQVMFALQRDLLTDFLGRPAPVETME